MTWWGWLLLAAYIIGWAIAVPRVGWVIATEGGAYSKVEGDDVVFGLLFGSLASLAWPLIFPAYHCYSFAKSHGRSDGLLTPPRAVRRRNELKEREREVAERESRIAQMERELGLGKPRLIEERTLVDTAIPEGQVGHLRTRFRVENSQERE